MTTLIGLHLLKVVQTLIVTSLSPNIASGVARLDDFTTVATHGPDLALAELLRL